MRKCQLVLKNGEEVYRTIYEYPQDRIDFSPFFNITTVRKLQSSKMKNRQQKGYNYLDLISTFDIETTTIKETHEGFMYCWQFCFGEDVYMGRTWEDFLKFIDDIICEFDISLDKLLVVYVHNLQYEFQFIRDFFDWNTIFAVGKREVLKATTTTGIEFRCSYKLSNMSLQKFCENSKNCVHVKQSGDLDYSIFRTPKTQLNAIELGYCYCDVKGLAECISDFLEDDTLATIPLTSTGFIRNECRKAMSKNPANRKAFIDMKMGIDVYTLLKEALRGGNTHGSRYFVGQIIENLFNFDVASSYPYVQCCKYFPISKFKKTPIKTKDFFEKELQKNCCLFRFFCKRIKLKKSVPIPYISHSKCLNSENVEKFNGRILYAENVKMTLTELDYAIIIKQYDIENAYISDFYTAKRGLLPKEMRDYIKERFRIKTELKGGDKYLYMKSKNKLNGIFGMSCTDCVHDIYCLVNGEWIVEKEDIQKSIDKFYKNSKSFLTYAWGVYTLAQARAHLQRIINITGLYTVYCDTDSDKCINPDFEAINNLNNDIKAEAERYGAYADYNGKRYYMGIFEQEENYSRFKTLGAKKYAYEDLHGNLHVTVSGVNTDNGPKELKKLENFVPGFEFKNAGGNKIWYNDMGLHTLMINGERILSGANAGFEERTYTLGVTDSLLEKININYLNLS